MKWTNKGKEFYCIENYYKNVDTIYLYGAWIHADFVLDQIEKALAGLGETSVDIVFIDRDINKQSSGYKNRMVISPEMYKQICESGDRGIVIVCVTENRYDEIWLFLESCGLIKNETAFNQYEWYRYMSLFIYYRFGKFYLHLADLFMNTYCNLNCKECFVQTYRGVRKRATIDEIKYTIDLLLGKADFVGIISFGIADGFMNTGLPEAIEYICANYRDKFYEIHVTTNGTIIPRDSFLNSLKNEKVKVVVDDYRDNVELARINYPLVICTLKERGIRFDELKRSVWNESGFGESININQKLDTCYKECICLAKGFPYMGYSSNPDRMYSCVFQTINTYLKLVPEEEYDSIDFKESSILEIIEFLLGYSYKGHLTACKYCKGVFEGVAVNNIPVAVQIEG